MSVIARAGDEASAVRRANAVAQAYIGYLPAILETQVAELDERLRICAAGSVGA